MKIFKTILVISLTLIILYSIKLLYGMSISSKMNCHNGILITTNAIISGTNFISNISKIILQQPELLIKEQSEKKFEQYETAFALEWLLSCIAADKTTSEVSIKNAFNNYCTIENIPLTFDEFQQQKNSLLNDNYFMFLGTLNECSCKETSRFNSTIRSYVENEVLKFVQTNKSSKINIISDLGSGNLFTIFVTLNKLINEGYNKIRLHLIDKKYSSLITKYNYFYKESKKINLTEITINKILINNECNRIYLQKVFDILNQSHVESTTKNLLGVMNHIIEEYQLHLMFIQFLGWFNTFNDHKISVYLYNDAEDYLVDSILNDKVRSDILLAIDYQIYESFPLYTIFNKLRTVSLKSSGIALNVTKDGTNLYFSKGNQTNLEHFEFQDTDAGALLTPTEKLDKITKEML